MSTLAHVFEAEGIATVALGSIQEHIEGIAPPRGLWCDFPLGRPLGKPNDADFQHRVLAHAFSLLGATEPVFEHFAESITDDANEVVACTLPPADDPDAHPAVAEARGIRQAYERALERYGNRMGAGRAVAADDIPAAIEAFAKIAEGTNWKEAGIAGIPARVAQDIRGYYETAALELIGSGESGTEGTAAADQLAPWSITRWFFTQTEAGRTLMAARQAMADAGEKQPIWFYLAPGDM